MYVFFPLPDVLQAMLAAVFQVFTWSQRVHTRVHRRPRRQLGLSGFQRAPVSTQPNVCWELMTNIIVVFPFFFISVVLVLPQLRRSRILSVSRKRDERGRGMKVPYMKQRRQKEMNTGCNFLTFSAAAFVRLAAEIFMVVPGVLEPLGRCGNHYGFFPLLQETSNYWPVNASRCHASWHQNQKSPSPSGGRRQKNQDGEKRDGRGEEEKPTPPQPLEPV